MKKISHFAATVVLASAMATPALAIDIVDDTPATIYAVGAKSSTRGVYTLPTSGSFAKNKISGTTYINYTFDQGGGTFTDVETVYGTSVIYGSSFYVAKASAAQGWDHDYYNYRRPKTDGPGYDDFTYEFAATDMTYDPTTKTIFGWFRSNAAGTEFHLGTFSGNDLASVATTTIGESTSKAITAIATAPDGQLWGIEGANGILYTIDKTDGTLTESGFIDVTAWGACQSAAFNPADGLLYWCAPASPEATTSSLYKINVTALTAELVYEMDGIYNAIFIPDPAPERGAPGTATGLTATFNGTSVDVTFTAPEKTFGDQKLTGDVDYVLMLDNAELDRGTTTPGATVTKDYTMADGTHTLSVTCSNAKGTGQEVEITFMSGFDAPGAVRNATASADGNAITITWEMPEALNGGIIDTEAITYTVTRMPGNVEVATGITDTTASDVITEESIAEYYYIIGVDGGLTATTNPVIVGHAHRVPYSQDFNSVTALNEILYKTLLTGSGADTWQLTTDDGDGNTYVSVTRLSYYEPNDHLFTAPIALKANVEYTLNFKVANKYGNPNNPQGTNLTVVLATAQSTDPANWVDHLLTDYSYVATADSMGLFRQVTVTFTPAESGEYYLGFIDSASRAINTVAIDDIELDGDEDNNQSAITDVTAAPAVSIAAGRGTLTVTGAAGMTIVVADVAGRIVAESSAHGHTFTAALRPGIYIVNINNHISQKINL